MGSKAGRPRAPGRRTASGRLSRAGQGPVEPNSRVVAARAAFQWFQSGKASQQIHDPIGRAWAVGLFQGFGCDPAALRDAGREYGDRYWGEMQSMAPVMGSFEGAGRGRSAAGGDHTAPDPGGIRFKILDDAVTNAGRPARDALHSLVIAHFWFPDEDPAWLARLITQRRQAEHGRRAKKGEDVGPAIVGELPFPQDRAKLELAVLAILAIVAGTGRGRIERQAPPSLAELTRPAEIEATPLPPIDPAFLDDAGRMRPWADVAEVIRERISAQA